MATGSALALSPDQMTGWKTNLLQGNVKQVSQSDGAQLIFNRDGNLVEEKRKDGMVLKNEYGDATHYLRTLPEDPYPYEITFTADTRSEMWYNTHENLGTIYTFDNRGRLVGENVPGYGTSTNIEYFYNGEELLPYKTVLTENDYDWEGRETSEYTYHQTDEHGNWTKCSVKSVKRESYYDENAGRDRVTTSPATRADLTRTITYFTASEMKKSEKYSKNVPLPGQKAKQAKNKPGKSGDGSSNLEWPTIIAFILIILMSAHMIYVRFFRKPRFPHAFSVDGFAANRAALGLPQTAGDAENREAGMLLDKAWEAFPVVFVEGTEEFRKPMAAKHIRKAVALIKEAEAFNPTDPDVVSEMNRLAEVINSNTRRVFGGSWGLILVGLAVALLVGFTVEPQIIFIYIPFLGVYWLSTQIPAYLKDKRMMNKVRNTPDATFNFMGEMIANSKVVRTTITWNDNSKTVHDDYSETGVNIFITIIVTFMMGVMIPLWSIFCYIRNYLLRRA